MATPHTPEHTSKQLIRATLLAAVGAGLILVTVVMPAEYGVDPVGSGKALGIFRPRLAVATDEPTATAASASPPAALSKQREAFRSDDLTLQLASGEGAEIKARMRQGQRFVFTWTAEGGPVNFDMHGDRANATDEFSSFWQADDQTSGHGAFEAPFDGNHGWFWQNLNAETVRIRLRTSGFYEHMGPVDAK